MTGLNMEARFILYAIEISLIHLAAAAASSSLFVSDLQSNLSEAIICQHCLPGHGAPRACVYAAERYIKLNSSLNMYVARVLAKYYLCKPCPPGMFSAKYAVIQRCRKCSLCPPHQHVVKPCTSVSNTQCSHKRSFELFTKFSPFTKQHRVQAFMPTTEPEEKTGEIAKKKTLLTAILVPLLVLLTISLAILARISRKAKAKWPFSDTCEVAEEVSPSNILEDGSMKKTSETVSMECGDEFLSPGDSFAKGNRSFNEESRKNHSLSSLDYIHRAEFFAIPTFLRNSFKSYSESSGTDLRESLDGDSVFQSEKSGADNGITVSKSLVFGSDGDTLDIEGTSVSIRVPKGAIADGETKEITVSVHICRPNDWKELREAEETTDLPLVELGPKGSRFLKPVEVIIRRSPGDELNKATFEYTEEDVLSPDAVWRAGIECKSRKKAKSTARTRWPNVAFTFNNGQLHAFYLHFTGGRIKRSKLKDKWMNVNAFYKTNGLGKDTVGLKVVFWEQTPEGDTLMKKETAGFLVAALSQKSLNVKNNSNLSIEVAISKAPQDWTLLCGDNKQSCPFHSVFDIEYFGNLPVADFVFSPPHRPLGVTDFFCVIDIHQGKCKEADLKISISKDFFVGLPRGSTFSSCSSGIGSMVGPPVYKIDDEPFRNYEPKEYLRKVFLQLLPHVAAEYEMFARHLGIEDHRIAVAKKNNPLNAEEACYSLLVEWLNVQETVSNMKKVLMDKLKNALENTSCQITLPNIAKETTV